jgi:hypothetical protein
VCEREWPARNLKAVDRSGLVARVSGKMIGALLWLTWLVFQAGVILVLAFGEFMRRGDSTAER